MLRITEPLTGTFIVEGADTENSIGLEVRGCGLVEDVFESSPPPPFGCYCFLFVSIVEDAGPQMTADCFAKVNSISISVAPIFLNGSLNFWAALPAFPPFFTTTGTTL
jgi:hypothetical protein